MAYQTNWNGYIAYKVQSALGTQATGSGASVLRVAGGPGGRLTKAAIESQEVRQDGMSTRGRHGSRHTGAQPYSTEQSIGSMDDVLEAVMRGTWTAEVTITEATGGMSSATLAVAAHTITASTGSWITSGLAVGDVIKLTAGFVAGNTDTNFRITGLTATVITVNETLTVEAGPLSTYTVVRTGRKLINPAAGSLVRRYFTIEECETDIDASELFTDCVWGGLRFEMQANGLLMCNPSWMGTGQYEGVSAGSSPFFSSPTTPTGVPMAVLDAAISINGTDLVDLTSFDLTIDNQLSVPDMAASAYAPDVFDGNQTVAMNLTALRQDLSYIADLDTETVLSLHVLAVENESEPKSFFSLFIPNFTLGGVDKSALAKRGGARTQTLAVPSALVGIDETGGAYDSCQVKMQISNNS